MPEIDEALNSDIASDASRPQGGPLASTSFERVGVVLVHGIGEQRRFEHADNAVREIVRALQARGLGGAHKVSVDVRTGNVAGFHSEQDVWLTGEDAPIRVFVRDLPTKKNVEINFHEVWWADVNEPYSLFKQLRFWRWGLAVWAYPRKLHTTLAGGRDTRDPAPPGAVHWYQRAWVRIRLFGVSFVAALGAASVGMVAFLAKRLLNLEPPDVLKVFVNYVAGVKLYNQKRRFGGGLWPKQMDFLESINEPPRVSVRRRMIRALAEAAMNDYTRWYVLAHSLGTVVAFNGLMETSYAWPGYFDEDTWVKLRARRFAGSPRDDWIIPPGDCLPRRPAWIDANEVAYRSAIFQKFHGFLSFGSPLEKFATLWPGRVPISTEPAFREGVKWLNVYTTRWTLFREFCADLTALLLPVVRNRLQ